MKQQKTQTTSSHSQIGQQVSKDPMKRFYQIDRLLADHRNRYTPPESPPNTFLPAYEDKRFNKMSRQLGFVEQKKGNPDLIVGEFQDPQDSHNVLKSKILIELVQDLVDGNKAVLSVMTSDIIAVLVEHLEDPNHEIRELTSQALAQYCKIMKTREIIQEQQVPAKLKDRIHDPVVEIRRNTYIAMLAICRTVEGAQSLIQIDMVKTLVDKLAVEEVDEIELLMLELLRQFLLVDGGTTKAVEIGVQTVELHLSYLESKKHNPDLREATLKNLYSFSFDYRGKELMMSDPKKTFNCVEKMIKDPLRDPNLKVRTAAALVLASLVQLNEAKHQVT